MLCAKTTCCYSFTLNETAGGGAGTCALYSTRKAQANDTPGVYTYGTPFDGEELFSNLAFNRTTQQRNTLAGKLASRAVDGNLTTHLNPGNMCSHTFGCNPCWWQVDMDQAVDVFAVVITNRGDCCGERLHDFDVLVYDEDPASNPSASSSLCTHFAGPMGLGLTVELPCCPAPISGRFVRISNGPGPLSLCEVQVMGLPSN